MKNLALILLITLNIFLCFSLLNNKKKNSFTLEEKSKVDVYTSREISKSFINTLRYEHKQVEISDSAKMILNPFIKKGNTLIFRINFPYCESCIYPVIEELNKNTKLKRLNTLIITSFPNFEYAEDFNLFMKDKSLKAINIQDKYLSIDQTENTGAYLCVYESDFSICSIFFPNKYNFFILSDYLNYLVSSKIL